MYLIIPLSIHSLVYGKFLSSICETEESIRWYQVAIKCYKQWGACAKADQLEKENCLDSLLPGEEKERRGDEGLKHNRDEKPSSQASNHTAISLPSIS